jgi:adenosine deaminase
LTFSDALRTNDLAAIRNFKKADLHNHCLLGGKRSVLEGHFGKKFGRFRAKKRGIGDLNRWIDEEFRPYFDLPGAFEKAIEAAFIQARHDGVTRLEMSMDAYIPTMFNVSAGRIVAALKHYHQEVAPAIDFLPELGFARQLPAETLQSCFESFAGFGYFRSIDLYDDEFAQPVRNYQSLYRSARKLGMKCKAHAGEFGTADSVKEAVETLELDAVQHGIGAAGSPEVMKWLAQHRIPLNVCPACNIRLKRVKSYKVHPIRILADNGVMVTIGTDDALIFGVGNSEQYLKLFRSGTLSADQLEEIRKNGFEK